MTDPYRWQRRAAFIFKGAAALALLWPCAALVRGTTAHDWYAAVKLTVTEAMITVGFNRFEPTRYRASDGTSYSITRGGLVVHAEPIEARDRILYTAAVGALHGALAGALCAVLSIMLWRSAIGWSRRRAEWPVRPPARGPPRHLDTRDRSGIAEEPPVNETGGEGIALWVLSARQAARLMEVLGAVKGPRAVQAQRSLEHANQPLLLSADTARVAAESAGTEPGSTGASVETACAPAAPGGTAQADAGGGTKPRATSEAAGREPEAGQADPEDGDDLNWI